MNRDPGSAPTILKPTFRNLFKQKKGRGNDFRSGAATTFRLIAEPGVRFSGARKPASERSRATEFISSAASTYRLGAEPGVRFSRGRKDGRQRGPCQTHSSRSYLFPKEPPVGLLGGKAVWPNKRVPKSKPSVRWSGAVLNDNQALGRGNHFPQQG